MVEGEGEGEGGGTAFQVVFFDGERRRRIPITGKVNCCFLVVLKRSRKMRNRREKACYFPRRNPEFNDRLQGLGVDSENYEMAMARGNLSASYFLHLGPNYDDWYELER